MIATVIEWLHGIEKKSPASFAAARHVAKSARANIVRCCVDSNLHSNLVNISSQLYELRLVLWGFQSITPLQRSCIFPTRHYITLRGTPMKTCICRECGHVFVVQKVKPFCSGECRRAYTLIHPKPTSPNAYLVGASHENQTNQEVSS